MEEKLYTWDDLYERADGTGFGDPELTAKDKARFQLTEIIQRECGYNIDDCEIPEEEIDGFLWESDKEYLFDEDGNLIKLVKKHQLFVGAFYYEKDDRKKYVDFNNIL